MMVLKKLKQNLFAAAMIFAYIVLFIARPATGIEAVKNSGYYIKEMLMIMPVIFVLTALLDMWVPKEKIMRFLGEESKAKGVFLSFVIGSISAGPVYAAFPMCVMLHKKGASVRNIVIILSSWAVIKVPMLLNEAKFLGVKFMAIRWVLTVLAIILFSWLTARIVKDHDLPDEAPTRSWLRVNRGACMGCALCAKTHPALFEMQGKKAAVKAYEPNSPELDQLQSAIEACPVHAIAYSQE